MGCECGRALQLVNAVVKIRGLYGPFFFACRAHATSPKNDLIIAMPDNPLAAMPDRNQNRSIPHQKERTG